tara:strand:+ start:284 stop:703 length:420 start_codon:yes stop_codon:yes gene_type:complete
MKTLSKNKDLFNFENLVGLLLAILIIFDLKVETRLSNLLNTPIGLISSLIIVILLFILMNPVIGILFLIYLYETIKVSTNDLFPSLEQKTTKMKELNKDLDTKLEESVVNDKAPIINKDKNNNVSFKPYEENNINMYPY